MMPRYPSIWHFTVKVMCGLLVLYPPTLLQGSKTILERNGIKNNEMNISPGKDVSISCEVTDLKKNTGVHRGGQFSNIIWKKMVRGEVEQFVKVEAGPNVAFIDCSAVKQPLTECDGLTLSVLTLKNVSVSNAGIYACYAQHGQEPQELIDQTTLNVGYPPDEPRIRDDDFISYWSEDILESCWETGNGNTTYIPTGYIMLYCYRDNENNIVTQQTVCKRNVMGVVYCAITYESAYMTYSISLQASNALGNATSLSHQIIPCKHAKSTSPTNLNLTAISTMNENKINIKWTEPDEIGIHHYTYRIRFREEKLPDVAWKIKYGTLMPQISLDGLLSETRYIVEVSAHPEDNTNVIEGVWSDWSQNGSISTGLAAPTTPFIFNQALTTVLSSGVHFLVDLSWYPYDSQHETGFYNNLCYGGCSQQTKFTSEVRGTNHFSFNSTETKICVEGAYCNDAGCSRIDSKIINPRAGPPVVENVVAETINDTQLSIKWTPSLDEGSCSVQICAGSRYDDPESASADPYNICGSDGFTILKSVDVACSAGNVDIHGLWSPCFLYSVIVEKQLSNYVVQSNPSQEISYKPLAATLQYFDAKDESSPRDFKIAARWSRLESCHNMPLRILYQPVQGAECDGDANACHVVFSKLVDCDETAAIISSNVYGDTHYEMEMALVCDAWSSKRGNGSRANVANRYAMYTIPIGDSKADVQTKMGYPGPPKDIKMTSHAQQDTTLIWSQPLHKNGMIYYEVIQRRISHSFGVQYASKMESLETSVHTDSACLDGENDTVISFSVRAINSEVSYASEAAILNITCVVKTDALQTEIDKTLVIAMCISLVFITIVLFVSYCFRKKIKMTLKTHVWPDLPKTSVFVNLSLGEYDLGTISKNDEVADCIMFPTSNAQNVPVGQNNSTSEGAISPPSSYVSPPDSALPTKSTEQSRQSSVDSGSFDCRPADHLELRLNKKNTLNETDEEPYYDMSAVEFHKEIDSSGYSSYNGGSNCSAKYRVCRSTGGSSSVSCRPHSFSGTTLCNYTKEYMKFSHELQKRELHDTFLTETQMQGLETEFLLDRPEKLKNGPPCKCAEGVAETSEYKGISSYIKLSKPILRRYWSWGNVDSNYMSESDKDLYVTEDLLQKLAGVPCIDRSSGNPRNTTCVAEKTVDFPHHEIFSEVEMVEKGTPLTQNGFMNPRAECIEEDISYVGIETVMHM